MLDIAGVGEAGPAGAGVELGVGGEKFLVAGGAVVHAVFFVSVIFAAEWCFSAFLAEDFVLLEGELLFVVLFVVLV